MKKIKNKDIDESIDRSIIIYVRDEPGTGFCLIVKKWFEEKKIVIDSDMGGREPHLKIKPYKFRLAFKNSAYLLGFLENSHDFINLTEEKDKVITYRQRLDNSEELIYQMFE